jgi:hypothetical protein
MQPNGQLNAAPWQGKQSLSKERSSGVQRRVIEIRTLMVPKQWQKTLVLNSSCAHGKAKIYQARWTRTADRNKYSIIRLDPPPVSMSACLCRQAHDSSRAKRLRIVQFQVKYFSGVRLRKLKAIENPQTEQLNRCKRETSSKASHKSVRSVSLLRYREDLQS